MISFEEIKQKLVGHAQEMIHGEQLTYDKYKAELDKALTEIKAKVKDVDMEVKNAYIKVIDELMHIDFFNKEKENGGQETMDSGSDKEQGKTS